MNKEYFSEELIYKNTDVDALFVGINENIAPLQGISSFIDWKLNSIVSNKIISKQITGATNEVVLIPSNGKLAAKNIFFIGLGSLQKPAPIAETIKVISEIIKEMKIENGIIAAASFQSDILKDIKKIPIELKILG